MESERQFNCATKGYRRRSSHRHGVDDSNPAAACELELAMSYEDMAYHRQREQQCRDLAETASDPDVRRRHEELADLHASRIAQSTDVQR